MIAPLSGVMAFASFPAVAVLLGAAATFIRTPSAAVRSGVQHLAAGVIFCVLATELLPDLVHRRMPWVTVVGFSIGVAVMLALKWAGEREGEGGAVTGDTDTRGLMTAMAIDVALDGMLIGLSFAAGQRQGMLLTTALVLELFFLGVSCATTLGKLGRTRGRIMVACAGLGAALLAGATAGAVVLNHVKPAIVDAMLAFGVAALLYLVTEELLTEAHEEPETPVQTAMFFLGFIVLFTLDMLV
jgi:ZIP family zinc transporter